MNKPYYVHAEWDAGADIWVATSDEVPGLATEANSPELLNSKLNALIPQLLELNGVRHQRQASKGPYSICSAKI